MSIAENLKAIKARAGSAVLVAVSKRQPPEKILEALGAGQRVFGENRVQEAQAHWAYLRGNYPDLELHLIGPLQTNKVKEAVSLFDVIQTVDRGKLATALGAEMKRQARILPCFVQVNTGEEEQKAGIPPQNLKEFLEFCRTECGLTITGLMCIPPVNDPPALHFALLKKMAAENGLEKLSMGMSGDFEKALALGATHIRVGSAIFGERA
jgi:pyridoxal phosphate enzyme (YggS family)